MRRTPIFENDFFQVMRHEEEPIVVVVRSSKPFQSPNDIARAFSPMLVALDVLGRREHYLLLDSRDAVGNNDPAYEASFADFRRRLFVGFPKTAVLVRTPAGRLHSRRLMGEHVEPERAGVFTDPILALASLRAAIRRSTPPRSR